MGQGHVHGICGLPRGCVRAELSLIVAAPAADVLICVDGALVRGRSGEMLRLLWRRNARWRRSEEHTSELQSRGHLVCRLLLEKKKDRNANQLWPYWHVIQVYSDIVLSQT